MQVKGEDHLYLMVWEIFLAIPWGINASIFNAKLSCILWTNVLPFTMFPKWERGR